MGATINYNFPIYDDDWPPDLTSTGAEAQAIIDIDTELKRQETQESEDASRLNQLVQDERTERTDADTTLQANIDKETEERKTADSELKSSVENVENELTPVSADVTGVFGLTYGDDNVNFVEKSGDTYSSPALIEIQHQIADASAAPAWDTVTDKPFERVGSWLSVDETGDLYVDGTTLVTSISPLRSDGPATSEDTTAFAAGAKAKATKDKAVAIGYSASAKKSGAIALGSNSSCNADNSISIGGSTSSSTNGTALGYRAASYSTDTTSVGYRAICNGAYDCAVGSTASANKSQSTAVGYSATCSNINSVALGANAATTRDNELSIGSGTAGDAAEVTRYIAHVKTPENPTDAANMDYVDAQIYALDMDVLEGLRTSPWSTFEAES